MNSRFRRIASTFASSTRTKLFSLCLPGNLTALCLALCAVALCMSPSKTQAQTYTPNYIYTRVGGGLVIPNPSTPLTADVPGPSGVIKDSSGDIYFDSPTSEYLYELSSAGVLTTVAGQGIGGFAGDGGPASSALVSAPTGMAIDSSGNIYFSDAVSNRVRMISAAGNISTVAGSSQLCIVSTNPCGDGGQATSANLYEPQGLAVDNAGNLYIADSFDNRIRKVVLSTGIISTVAGTGTQCASSTSACGDGASATAASLNTPFGVAVDSSGNIYIADTFNQRVRIVTKSTGNIGAYAGSGAICDPSYTPCGDGGAPTAALLHIPKDVVVDASGDLYIADSGDHRIRYVPSGAATISTFAGLVCTSCTSNQGFSGDGGSPTAAELNFPQAIVLDSSGNLTIADTGNQRIRVVTAGATPVINSVAGGGTAGDGGPATQATLAKPLAVAIEPAGTYLIADQGHNRIRRFNPSTGIITNAAGSPTGILGYTGDGSSATLATLNTPFGVVADSNDNIYIADSYNLVVRQVNGTTGNIITYAGNGEACVPQISACGDGGPATSGNLTQPTSVSVDGSGDLFITDFFDQKVREVLAVNQDIYTAAGDGAAGYNGDGILATKAKLKFPFGIAADAAGDFFVADTENSRIRLIGGPNSQTAFPTLSPGYIETYALNGGSGFGGDDGLGTKASMGDANQVSIDPALNVYISGGIFNVVQRVDYATGIIATVAGTINNPEISGFSGDGGPASLARLNNAGVWVDSTGDLYIADTGNNRIRYVLLAPAAALTPADKHLSFPATALNTTSNPMAVTLKNSGAESLTIPANGISTTGAFAQTNNCGTGLAPTQNCTIDVTFTPTQDGDSTGSLTINDNVTGAPQTVSLMGVGPDFTVAASPTTVTSSPTTAGTTAISVTPSADFNQLVTLSCSGLPKGAKCSFSPSSVTPNGSSAATSTLTITVGSTTPTGSFAVTVRGAHSPVSASTGITLTVQ